MGVTLIIRCYRCSSLFLASKSQKTRTCPYCNTRIELQRAEKIASGKDAFTASEILRDLKNKTRDL